MCSSHPKVIRPVRSARRPSAWTRLVRVDLARIQAQLPYRIAPVYVLLQERTTTDPEELPLPAPLPELSEGPHLSYAVQWFTFATIALVGFVIVALREGRESSAARADDLG